MVLRVHPKQSDPMPLSASSNHSPRVFALPSALRFGVVLFVKGRKKGRLQENLCLPAWCGFLAMALQLLADISCVMLALVYGWHSLSKFLPGCSQPFLQQP